MKRNIDVPASCTECDEYVGAVQIGTAYLVFMKYEEDDFSVWLTDDMNYENWGVSTRADREGVMGEIAHMLTPEDYKYIKNEILK